MNELLQAVNLQKIFTDGAGKTIEILRGINLSIKEASSLAIVGQSGTGKSTLLHILGGLDFPSKGQIICEGVNIHSQKPDKIAEWRNSKLGFVFQAHHLLSDLSAVENVMMPAFIGSDSKSQALRKAERILKNMGLGNRLNHKVVNLSGGEQQRVAIARALMNSPKFILADEPTGNLDEKTGKLVAEIMLEVCLRAKAALIIVTHNSYLASMSDRSMVLENGLLTAK